MKKPKRAKGYNSEIYTVTFKPASQTVASSSSANPAVGPISINSASGNGVAALRPLFPTPTGVNYSPEININSSTTSLPGCEDLSMGIDFQIQNIENIGAYLELFDYYRLNWVKIEVESLYSSASTGTTGATGGPTIARPFSDLYMAVDLDSSAVPDTQQEVTGIDGVKRFRFTDVKNRASIVLRPKPAVAVETRPATGGLQNLAVAIGKTNTWQNSVNPAVNYYGLKLWYTNWMNTQSAAQMSALRFTFTYNVSFKQPLKAC